MNTIDKKTISEIESILDYTFKSKSKLIQALSHSSSKKKKHEVVLKQADHLDNERLEFLGDAILDFVISKKLFEIFPDKNEGHLSKCRSLLVSKKSLFTISKKLRLHHYLIVGKNEARIKLADKTKMLSDALEAIIAAIYLDRGLKTVEEFILQHFDPYLEPQKLKRLDTSENDKTILQELTQKHFHELPVYKTIAIGNEEGFQSTLLFQKEIIGSGEGKSKREAEKKAAKEGLRIIKKSIKDNK